MEYLDTVLNTFPVDTGSTKQLHLTETSKTTRIYRVETLKSPILRNIQGQLYLIDTPAGRKIACHPHLVSNELSGLCLDAANELKKTLKELGLISEKSGILHILRGSSGYMVDKALPDLPLFNIRTQYLEDGYRAHSDDSRRITVTYSDYKATELDTLVVPDTYATGRSVEAALQYMFAQGLSLDKVVLYGFIAAAGIERVYNLLSEYGVELVVFAICDITQLYSNNYDMPLYGLDEHLYKETGKIKPLGSVVALETLRDMLPHYVPGMDQPGDWSERHINLYNGYGEETGDIRGHLEKSIALIKSLDELNRRQPWYNDNIRKITEKEIKILQSRVYSLH
ncbi:MAG: hypothetical protein NWF07_16480 [Candidatus Bathyarchaeota archaeon]|nr:hypothetical protein [Candidatus Bathyarchaeota archaeon]